MSEKIAVVLGVGAPEGLGAAMCRRAAQAAYHVVPVGRTAEKVEKIAQSIVSDGGKATAKTADTTKEADVVTLFESLDDLDGELTLVVFNVGNAYIHDSLTMPMEYFEEAWRTCCLGGFLTAREAGKRLVEKGHGTILFTGATASLRARAPFLAFASAKAALRSVAAAFARELGPQGVHVAHVIVDGVIDGERANTRMPEIKEKLGEEGMLDPDAIAENYWQIHLQHPSSWTFEMDVRPFKESF